MKKIILINVSSKIIMPDGNLVDRVSGYISDLPDFGKKLIVFLSNPERNLINKCITLSTIKRISCNKYEFYLFTENGNYKLIFTDN